MDIGTALILGAALGMWLGGALRNMAWAENADHPAWMLYRGKFYKVTRLPAQGE